MFSGQSRRSFLHVGFCGGVGLSLAQYFQLKSAQADIKQYESKEGSAKSVIFIFLPGGMDIKIRRAIGRRHPPIRFQIPEVDQARFDLPMPAKKRQAGGARADLTPRLS